MTFNWTTPPWLRHEDCTHMATTLTHVGDGEINPLSEGVRGVDATEALADLIMGPGGRGGMLIHPGLVGVVIRRGIDVMWMAKPPVRIGLGDREGEWRIDVDADDAEVTVFSAPEVRELSARLREAYGTT
ncbi:hypothetical protein [Embleya hyalina]|uniref:Uncharacterized protein n=1 Tax=Embleya hyalina TaxID=516124 RepID=A0A401Z423_9ACTN|nr:hypothetical protein [Embleya hyalina]GCE01588.1 hypothetical protein EHYA_09354 [Embleya hyalina]